MTDHRDDLPLPDYSTPEPRTHSRKPTLRTALIGGALLALGVGGGAVIAHSSGPRVEMAPVSPVAIKSLTDDTGVVSVRGKIAETFGPMIVLADGIGRALIDLGRQGDGTGLVSAGQNVTVQGHFRHGMIRASFLVGGDGKVVALHPMGPEHGGPGGREGPGGEHFRHGPHGGPGDDGPRGPGDRGPDGGPDGAGAPPPPPAGAAPTGAAAAPAAPATANKAG